MLKRRNEQVQFVVRFTDAAVCILAFFFAYWLGENLKLGSYGGVGSIESLSWILAASIVLHFLIYPYFRFYESLRLKRPSDIILMVLQALVTEFFILGSLVFFVQAKSTSRYFFGAFLVVNYSLVLLEKIGARFLLSSIRKRGYNYRQLLIVGTGKNARRLIEVLQRNSHWGYVPCGCLSEGTDQSSEKVSGVPVLGSISQLESIIWQRSVDEVYFALDVLDPEYLHEQMVLCERTGIVARFSLGMFDLEHSKVTFSALDRMPVLTFYTTLMTPLDAFLKRALDICVALIGLVITGVFYPWVAWRIRRDSPGPVIFKQPRVGENGRTFKCYKFRTMHVDAEARKAALMTQNQMEGPLFKMENDPRVFPFGAFLRRTSIDELPQFLNILRGDMSVVGTRPPTIDEVRRYRLNDRRRLSVRPGLTGLWQVSGRNSVTKWEDVVALDLKYIDNWSIWLDIQIIFRTVWVTLFRKGAY